MLYEAARMAEDGHGSYELARKAAVVESGGRPLRHDASEILTSERTDKVQAAGVAMSLRFLTARTSNIPAVRFATPTSNRTMISIDHT